MRAATLAELPLLVSLERAHYESAGFLYQEGPARQALQQLVGIVALADVVAEAGKKDAARTV